VLKSDQIHLELAVWCGFFSALAYDLQQQNQLAENSQYKVHLPLSVNLLLVWLHFLTDSLLFVPEHQGKNCGKGKAATAGTEKNLKKEKLEVNRGETKKGLNSEVNTESAEVRSKLGNHYSEN